MTLQPASRPLVAFTLVAVLACPVMPGALQGQNPSPMVEHTRPHPRLSEAPPEGQREPLELGTLFVPKGLKKSGPLFIHFHGGSLIPEIAAARNKVAVISIQLGSGSSVYGRPFADPLLFGRLIAEAEAKSHRTFTAIVLTSWSAGYGAVRAILRVPDNYTRVDRVMLIDGMHASYAGGAPGTGPGQSSVLVAEDLAIFADFARDAVNGRKRMIVSHSEIFPGTYASTTETADWLVASLGLTPKAVLKWGPAGMQQLREARRGRFLLIGYAGNSAPDHVDQLHALPEFFDWLK